ncbi:sugar transferase [Microbacterium kunmingense]|uniref:sugar transferase n=1 Tax=Microbacterium kunmingense TaxID=2915939 RepID=UPI0020032507|nr:sugar transferase [Microbacterium kunmingense]
MTYTTPHAPGPDSPGRPEPQAPPAESVALSPRTGEDWRKSYSRRLWLTDLLALVWSVYGTQLLWFGFGNVEVAIRADSRISEFSYWLFSGGLVIAWMWVLALVDARSYRTVGTGNAQYIRIVDASLRLFGAIAIIAFRTRVDVRGYLLIALPLGILALLLTRWLWRQWLIAQRMRGQYSARIILVGSVESVAQVAREPERAPRAGYIVIGACAPSGKVGDMVPGTSIPMMESVNAVERAMELTGADTVAVTSTDSQVHRRFLVKPGITGLWQISGRSTLSWEETVRLDLFCVKNWTMLGDLAILTKTARAALAPGDSAR